MNKFPEKDIESKSIGSIYQKCFENFKLIWEAFTEENKVTQPASTQTSPQSTNKNSTQNEPVATSTVVEADNEEEEYDSSFEIPILYVTVWLDDQGNIIKDAIEDAKTPASERQPVKIPGYRHYRTSISDGITKFLYKKVGTSTNSTDDANITHVTEPKPNVDTQSNNQPNKEEAKQDTMKVEPSKQPETKKKKRNKKRQK